MSEKEKKPKVEFEEKVKCPHCEKRIIVKKTKLLVEKALPAEYEKKVIVEKDDQKTIKESTEKKDDEKPKESIEKKDDEKTKGSTEKKKK